jgi:hypothetical protein
MILEEITQHKQRVSLWVDLDGVLCDFNFKVKELTGKVPSELTKKDMWKAVYSIPDFFEKLPWTPDGKQLWEYVKPFHPTILTGLPCDRNGERQKRVWCAEQLGSNVPVIVCPSKDKHLYARPSFILIDDRGDNIEAWKHAGGIGILHRNTKRTTEELKQMGI